MNMKDINNEVRKRIQDANCIEEELLVWNDIFDAMDERERKSFGTCTGMYGKYFVDPIQVAYVTRDLIPFKNVTEDEVVNLPLKKFKTRDMSEDEQYDIIKRCANLIQYIDNPSDRIQIEACRYDGSLLKYIKNPCIEAKVLASRNVYNLKFIENPTDEMYAMAFYDMQHNTINGKKVNTRLFALLRLLNIIPKEIYKERVIEKEAIKHITKKIEKDIVPIIVEQNEKVEKAYESQDELKIRIAEASVLYTAFKLGRKLLVSGPLTLFMFMPKTIFKLSVLVYNQLYLSEMNGIKKETYEMYERYSGKFNYGHYYAKLVETGVERKI